MWNWHTFAVLLAAPFAAPNAREALVAVRLSILTGSGLST